MRDNKDLVSAVEAKKESILLLEQALTGEDLPADVIEDYGLDDPDDWFFTLFGSFVLEATTIKRNDELSAIELLLGYGGPSIRATVYETGRVDVKGDWWFDTYSDVMYAETLADTLFDVYAQV